MGDELARVMAEFEAGHEEWLRRIEDEELRNDLARAAFRASLAQEAASPARTNGYRRQRRKRGYRHWPSRRVAEAGALYSDLLMMFTGRKAAP